MSEVESAVAEVPASEPVVTATPATEVVTPVVETPVVAPRTFTQEELDATIGKRLARERRAWEREHQETVTPLPVEVAPVDQFESVEAYAKAYAEKAIEQREQARRQSDVFESYHTKEEQARGKYDDFDQVAYNPKLPISSVMAQTIRESDAGTDVAYYLGTNPKEAQRISMLSPYAQAKEIGKIEATLAASPPVKKVSSAPAPFTPVASSGGGNSPTYDTTDPRSIASMSTSDWINAERIRQEKKWAAQHR